ncbi:MAG: response regulator [Thermodesulfobacteriota bacterium]|nr:response regulator [Thermodesulfobacteriota bacterium]
MNILVVDDDPVTRKLLEIRLSKAGYEIETAQDGSEATAAVSNRFFDVVITDLIMPGEIDGIGVLTMVKEKWDQTEVILLTAFATVETAVKAMKRGATDYLKKPIDFDELIIRLQKIAEVKSLAKDASDLREAMNVTEQSAAQTIQKLEMTVSELRGSCSNVMQLLTNNDIDIHERVQRALQTLSLKTSLLENTNQ